MSAHKKEPPWNQDNKSRSSCCLSILAITLESIIHSVLILTMVCGRAQTLFVMGTTACHSIISSKVWSLSHVICCSILVKVHLLPTYKRTVSIHSRYLNAGSWDDVAITAGLTFVSIFDHGNCGSSNVVLFQDYSSYFIH